MHRVLYLLIATAISLGPATTATDAKDPAAMSDVPPPFPEVGLAIAPTTAVTPLLRGCLA